MEAAEQAGISREVIGDAGWIGAAHSAAPLEQRSLSNADAPHQRVLSILINAGRGSVCGTSVVFFPFTYGECGRWKLT